ncbi:ArsC/Spx/MgsR family protein [Clostridium sp. DJ247]|uniref:ArsC/Spx/MgsR family protein n=1 Tax=Clostridium sp. DJ247 TaxID=2726188 RepID=UPI00162AD68C|nr:ArsC/Spx/MgsR family protein [Clostridium sp. DJ247]MBC2581995.1 nitrogenase-associated protein [Clostridium sp. DJ247]
MAHVIFYTKPGCAGGARQKALLIASGHTVEEHSIFDTTWTPDTLQAYLERLDIKEWYNKNAPAVKAGIVIPGTLTAKETLDLLCSNPILIKRPLMKIEDQLIAGFDLEFLSKLIELRDIPDKDLTSCQIHSESNPCKSPQS